MNNDVSIHLKHTLNSGVIKHKYAFIDALRAIAALLVVWSHAPMSFSDKNAFVSENDAWLFSSENSIGLGAIGVVIFFAISGFLIPSSFKGSALEGAKNFLIKRFFRLFPAFWVSIILGAVVLSVWDQPLSIETIAVNFTMIPKFLGFKEVMGVYWTLQIELLFYAICLFLFLCGKVHQLRFLSKVTLYLGLAGAFIALFFGKIGMINLSADMRYVVVYLSFMFWGAIWRKWQDGEEFKLFDKIALLSIPLIWCIARPAVGLLMQFVVNPEGNINLGFSLGTGILLFILGTTVIKIQWRLFSWLGEISYSIYLMHLLILIPFSWYSGRPDAPRWLQEPHMFVYVSITMILTVILSAINYKYVELPSINRGQRFATKMNKKKIMQKSQ